MFQKDAKTIKYYYPISKNKEIDPKYNLIEEASPGDDTMIHPDENHEFLGWIQGKSQSSRKGIPLNGYEWNKIYNIADDKYCTSDVDSALPYLIEKDKKVTETMDLYPVYTRYNIETTTNIHEVGQMPKGVKYPSKPTYTLTNKDKGISTITVNAKSGVDAVMQGDTAKYKLVGMNCINEDGTELNLWKDGKVNADGSYTFNMDVKAGQNYKFVAVYSPVVVVYHLSDKDLSYKIRNINSQVGAMPVTTNPDDLSMYMIGWVKNKPANGWYHTCKKAEDFNNTNYQIVTEKSIVKQSIDLYPVFVKTAIKVNSNIDAEIKDPSTIRYLENKNNKFSLVAKEVDGYKLKGWYKGYQSSSNMGTQLSSNSNHPLTNKEVMGDGTYTAVYEHAIDINYHDYEGKVIYTAKATKEEKRSFVHENPDDPTKKVPIDIDAFVLINEKIHQLEEAKNTKIRFVEWRLEEKNSDGKYVYKSWNDFKDMTITEEVNLYPVAYEVGFYTPSKSPGEADKVFNGIEYSVQQENDGSKRLDGLFTTEYSESKLKITTKEYTWERTQDNPNGAKIAKGLSGIHTDIYMTGKPDKDNNPTYVKASDSIVDTDKEGIAIHNILGDLTIKKEYTAVTVTDDTIILNLQKINKDGSPSGKVLRLPMKIKDGKGQLSVRIPIGTYEVTEDLNWSWRDSLKSIVTNGKASVNAQKTKVEISVLTPAEIAFSNVRENTKWFSDSSVKHNKFGKQNAGGNTK